MLKIHNQIQSALAKSAAAAALIAIVFLLLATTNNQQEHFNGVEASIGYFEHYGWPTYGIVKPFWMTPFSAFPSRALSGYSRKHLMRNGRGLSPFSEY